MPAHRRFRGAAVLTALGLAAGLGITASAHGSADAEVGADAPVAATRTHDTDGAAPGAIYTENGFGLSPASRAGGVGALLSGSRRTSPVSAL